jgi:general stress protein YciG
MGKIAKRKQGFAVDDISKIYGAKGGAAKGQDYQKGGIASKGFADDPERAREAGRKGGSKSKRGKAKPK